MHMQVEAYDEQSRKSVRGRAYRRYKYIDKNLLRDLYETQKKSTVDIARELGISRSTITEYMALHGIYRRKPGKAGAMKSRKYEVDPLFFDHIDSPDKAYVLGFILGDGHLYWRSKKFSAKSLKITLAIRDENLLLAIAKVLGCEKAVRYPKKSRSDRKTWQDKVCLDVNCTRLVDALWDFYDIPIGLKSGMEPFICFEDDSLTWAFIRGVFDADGCIRNYQRTTVVKGRPYTNPRCKFSITIGLRFVDGLVTWLKSRGFALPPKCAHQKSDENTWEFELASRKTLKQIRKYLYGDGNLFLARKKAIFDVL